MHQRIVFFGSGDYIIPIIEKLRKKGLEFVVTTEREIKDEPASTQRGEPTPPPASRQGGLISYLKEEGIPFISSDLKNPEDIEKLKHYAPTLGILASYGAIIKQSVIDMFIYGIFNIHPSLLPKYKGPSPIQAAILSGDEKTGVTIIRLDNQVDHGPILDQREVSLSGKENYLDLRKKLFEIGAEMIALKLEELKLKEHVVETSQEETTGAFTEKINKKNGQIDLDNPPSSEIIERMIRAYYPWPGVFIKTVLGGTKKIIKLLPDGKIQVEGKNPMLPKDFANGYQSEGREILSKLSLLS